MHELEVLQGEVVGGRGDGGGGGAVRGGGGASPELASPLSHEASGAGGGVLKIQLLDYTNRAFSRHSRDGCFPINIPKCKLE